MFRLYFYKLEVKNYIRLCIILLCGWIKAQTYRNQLSGMNL